MSNYNLWLDDKRLPENVTWIELPLVEWIIAKNYTQFVQIIQKQGLPLFVSFDHDLGDCDSNHQYNFGLTGLDCAKWLVNYCFSKNINVPTYYIHSLNPVGAENILGLLKSYQKHFEANKYEK
jgi:hypothetical protein